MIDHLEARQLDDRIAKLRSIIAYCRRKTKCPNAEVIMFQAEQDIHWLERDIADNRWTAALQVCNCLWRHCDAAAKLTPRLKPHSRDDADMQVSDARHEITQIELLAYKYQSEQYQREQTQPPKPVQETA